MRCVIVDDYEPFLQEARELLEREGIEVVGVATTTAEAVPMIVALGPELALVDIDLGDESGFALVRELVGQPNRSASRVILISAYAEADFADLIDASPAAGFISKAELSARAIKTVLGGGADPVPG